MNVERRCERMKKKEKEKKIMGATKDGGHGIYQHFSLSPKPLHHGQACFVASAPVRLARQDPALFR